MQNQESKNYLYPAFSPKALQFKGLLIPEWVIVIAFFIIPFLMFHLAGIVVGLSLAIGAWYLMYRSSSDRQNTLGRIRGVIEFSLSQKVFRKKPREDSVVHQEKKEDAFDEPKKKKSKKSKKTSKQKKAQKKKEIFMQSFLPFKYIDDNYVELENGDILVFLKVNANNLNFLNQNEINSIMTTFGKNYDRNHFKINFFIQDAVFKANNSVRAIEKARSKFELVEFVKKLGYEMIEAMKLCGKSSTKKASYMRIYVKKEILDKSELGDIIAKIKKNFSQTLSPSAVRRDEIKQLLAIFSNRLFATDFPDSEVEFEQKEQNLIYKSKKKMTYEEMQLPGIYEFKDLITPVTSRFLSSTAQIGSHKVKTYAVSCFLASTDDHGLLNEIVNLKGITTNMYIEELSLKRYRNSLKLDLKAKNSSIGDELDAVDINLEKQSSKDAYSRLKKDKQNMYYISVYFQLTADTEAELEKLEESFLEKCGDVTLSVDPLVSYQRKAYESVNPLGKNVLSNLVKQNVPSESVANLYPFSSSTLMDDGGLPIGRTCDTNESVLYNMFADRGSNQNVLLLGFSGVGKTTLLWLLLQNEMLLGSYLRNIDVEGICKEFTEALGGINFNMAGNNDYAINPLQIRIPDELRNGLVDDYVSEVRNFMSIYKSSWSERLLDIFQRYISRVYEDFNINNNTNLAQLKPKDYPLMEDIYKLVKKDKENYDPVTMNASLEDLREILIGLENCIDNGADAKLFNRHTNLGEGALMNDTKFINFDLSEMKNSSLNKKLAQWSNVFTFIGQFVNDNMDRNKRIVVSIDELHTFLKKQYMKIVEIIDDYERRFRKYGSAFIKATQTIEEFDTDDDDMKSKITTLFSQPATKFLFHLGDIKYELPKQLLNLKEKEVKKLQEARQGSCLMRVGQQVYDVDVDMPLWFAKVKKDVQNVPDHS